MRRRGDRLAYEDVVAPDSTPRVRSGRPNELWSYAEEVYEILGKYVRLREALRPYLHVTMAATHQDGQPVMRGLFGRVSPEPAPFAGEQGPCADSFAAAPSQRDPVSRRA
jgi:alpha-D-xyloside xylohydrolase